MGTLFVVSTPIGNLGDLTSRAAALLGEVDRVLAEDSRRTRILLRHLQLGPPVVSLHAHNEAARIAGVLGWLESGERLALVSDAGTPLVSDPGERLVRAVIEAGYDVVPIPGASAILAALVVSGFPSVPFAFLGFVPRSGGARTRVLDRLRASGETTVLFEAPGRVIGLLEDLERACGPHRGISISRELTKVHEETVRGGIGEVRALLRERGDRMRGEFVVVVSPAESGDGEVEGPVLSDEALRASAVELVEGGMSRSRAARELATRFGVPKARAWAIVHGASE